MVVGVAGPMCNLSKWLCHMRKRSRVRVLRDLLKGRHLVEAALKARVFQYEECILRLQA